MSWLRSQEDRLALYKQVQEAYGEIAYYENRLVELKLKHKVFYEAWVRAGGKEK